MLMRFSGEDMGEYTSLPEIFKRDKADCKKKRDDFFKGRGIFEKDIGGETKSKKPDVPPPKSMSHKSML